MSMLTFSIGPNKYFSPSKNTWHCRSSDGSYTTANKLFLDGQKTYSVFSKMLLYITGNEMLTMRYIRYIHTKKFDYVPDKVKILSVHHSWLLSHHLVSLLHHFPLKERKGFDGKRNLSCSSQEKLGDCWAKRQCHWDFHWDKCGYGQCEIRGWTDAFSQCHGPFLYLLQEDCLHYCV